MRCPECTSRISSVYDWRVLMNIDAYNHKLNKRIFKVSSSKDSSSNDSFAVVCVVSVVFVGVGNWGRSISIPVRSCSLNLTICRMSDFFCARFASFSSGAQQCEFPFDHLSSEFFFARRFPFDLTLSLLPLWFTSRFFVSSAPEEVSPRIVTQPEPSQKQSFSCTTHLEQQTTVQCTTNLEKQTGLFGSR